MIKTVDQIWPLLVNGHQNDCWIRATEGMSGHVILPPGMHDADDGMCTVCSNIALSLANGGVYSLAYQG